MQDLADAGVCTLKIEGRMKRPEYVAAAVTACRQALDGGEPDLETLRSVFSRSGFTDGYLTGKRTQDMFGYRTKEDVTAAEDVLEGLARTYHEAPDVKVPVRFFFEAHAGQPARLVASSGDDKAFVTGPEPALAMMTALSDEQVGRSLYKTGDTSYKVWKITCSIDPGLFLPASALNAMRREALETLEKERNRFFVKTKRDAQEPMLPPYKAPGTPQFRLRFETAGQIPDVPEDAVVILPVKEIAAHPELARRFGSRLWAELPPLVYGSAARDALEQALTALPGPVQDAVCGNIGTVFLAQKAGLRVHGGFELNVLNSSAAEEYRSMELEDVLLSPELAFAKMRKMKGEMPRGAILYGYLPLMKCRACPGKTGKGCGSCTGLSKLTDRTGKEFPLICREKQYSEILNCVPLYAADRTVPKLDFEELYFTIETKEECRRICGLRAEKAPADFPRTAGLYFRELL